MVKKTYIRKIFAVLCIAGMLAGLCACGGSTRQNDQTAQTKKTASANLDFSVNPVSYAYSMTQTDDSEPLRLSDTAAAKLTEAINDTPVDFPYADYDGVAELYDSLFVYRKPRTHKFNALDEQGNLTTAHLLQVIKHNNETYIPEDTSSAMNFGRYELPDDDLLQKICRLIVDVIDEMRIRFPDLDWDRVFCNLGNLKIQFHTGASLSLAAIDRAMVLKMNDNVLTLADSLKQSNGVRDTLIHEIMHILQLGCACEKDAPYDARCGISLDFLNVQQSSVYWNWFFEGSAEKETSLLTGNPTLTYQSKIGYLQSLDLSALAYDDIPAYFGESISFYSDPELLFRMFRCGSDEDRIAAAHLMRHIEIMQTPPSEMKDFLELYAEKTGKDVTDEAVTDELCYSIKPSVCLYFAKNLMRGLTEIIPRQQITKHDFYALLRLFEADADRHLGLSENRTPEINAPFLSAYKTLRTAFFTALAESGCGVSESDFAAFGFFVRDNVINAGFQWLPAEKQTFIFDLATTLDKEMDLLRNVSL